MKTYETYETYKDFAVEHARGLTDEEPRRGCLPEAARAFALSLAVWAPMAWLAGWFQ